MLIEIERKFLVATDAWRQKSHHKVRLRDGLLAAANGRKIRVRIADDQATLTVKGARTGLSRTEFEYPIPLADGEKILAEHCGDKIIEKTRHFVAEEGFVFEVDEYHDLLEGVIIAEAELDHPEQTIPMPAWLGEEITGREEFRKINMLKGKLRKICVQAG